MNLRCGQTLVQLALGTPTPECMLLKCIHRDVREYRIVSLVTMCLQGSRKPFRCIVGVVPQLESAVLLGWDCPLLAEILKKGKDTVKAKREVKLLLPLPAGGDRKMAEERPHIAVCIGSSGPGGKHQPGVPWALILHKEQPAISSGK